LPEVVKMDAETAIKVNRKEIDKTNQALVKLIKKRDDAVKRVTRAKKQLNIPMIDPERERIVIENSRRLAKKIGTDPEVVEKVMKIIIVHSRGLL
jgi:chorismate mutase